MTKCDKHKRNFVPNHCKICLAIVQYEKIERDLKIFVSKLKQHFNNCGDTIRSEELDKSMQENEAKKEEIDREYGKH